MDKASYEQWKALGDDIKEIRDKLITFMSNKKYQSLATARLTDTLLKALSQVDNFRSRAENRMLSKVSPSTSEEGIWLNVFYGDSEEEGCNPERKQPNNFRARFLQAEGRYGFIITPEEIESTKREAWAVIYSHSSSLIDRVEAFEQVLRSYFSRSLLAGGYNLQHPSFEEYTSMLLGQNHWQSRYGAEFPDVFKALLARYGTRPGIPEGQTIYKLA